MFCQKTEKKSNIFLNSLLYIIIFNTTITDTSVNSDAGIVSGDTDPDRGLSIFVLMDSDLVSYRYGFGKGCGIYGSGSTTLSDTRAAIRLNIPISKIKWYRVPGNVFVNLFL